MGITYLSTRRGDDGTCQERLDVNAKLWQRDDFVRRHIGPSQSDIAAMLETVNMPSLDALVDATVPASIRLERPLDLPPARGEPEVLDELRAMAETNELYRSFIGLGYHNCITPPVIQRNILENPGWYTQYTPYQAEIAQGRLEALLNFQTMIGDLTGLDVANASLLDEGTAAAEAMMLCKRAQPRASVANRFFVSDGCHPQTIAVIQTRAEPLGIEIVVGDHNAFGVDEQTFGVLLQYPDTRGDITVYDDFCARVRAAGGLVVVATDLLALTLLRPPGEFGADIAVGNSQRFGVPMGYGGPHAAFMAVNDRHKRLMPGRLVGVSHDAAGNPALRLALQTREQHIRRDRATSNICTAQVLLAIMASMYAVYHGPDGLRAIAERVRLLAAIVTKAVHARGYTVNTGPIFDTLTVSDGPRNQAALIAAAAARRINLRRFDDGAVGVALDETTSLDDLTELLAVFDADGTPGGLAELAGDLEPAYAGVHARTSAYLTHPVFNRYQSETEMLRYIKRLEARDLSLAVSMIPLGSCTMKLNATSEMQPISWPGFAQVHPFAPPEQTLGYRKLFRKLETMLAEITGFAAISLQPNAGSQGEYAGLLTIRAYHRDRGDEHRRVCLIPSSAHGTNPASAVMAGLDVVVVACDQNGNVDLDDLRAKAAENSRNLAAMMITYPSTHGVFEAEIAEICATIHAHGGQVYMDGANMNAQVGICRPGDFGADVCHLNLHKTFCIPHGGGGPGMGPIGVMAHLAPYLPGHPLVADVGGARAVGPVSSAPWGSPSILPISYAYIALMGEAGLTKATQDRDLERQLYGRSVYDPHYPILYTGAGGTVAHECIIDTRLVKEYAGAEDIAKRLMDYGFHAPTVSFPVAGTLMIEPTESESKAELDRFCDAMIAIREEIRAIERGELDATNNPLTGAPHTAAAISADDWNRPYGREQAAYPAPWLIDFKFWPAVGRIDNVYGDRHLVCACLPVEEYA